MSNTTVFNIMSLSQSLTAEPLPPDLCKYCRERSVGFWGNECSKLHLYYLIGAVATMIGTSFVMLSYICDPALRKHPSSLIVIRCFFDFLFSMCFFVTAVIDIDALTCNQAICSTLGPIVLFLFLCSNGFFAASIADLYLSLKNPFSSPHKLTNKLSGLVICICIAITFLCRYAFRNGNESAFEYRPDVQFCFIAPWRESTVNPFSAGFVYIPVVLITLVAFLVNIYAFLRLRKGLPDTFAIRMRSVQDAFSYSVGYTLYYIPLGILYFIIFYEDESAGNDVGQEFAKGNEVHNIFAVLLGCLGMNDVLLWYWRKFRKRKSKEIKENKMLMLAELKLDDIDEDSDYDQQAKIRKEREKQKNISRSNDLKEVLIPDAPANLFRAKSDKNKGKTNKSETKFQKLMKGVSIWPNTKSTTINKALRREVLAYTTDGIAQSIGRAKKLSEATGFETILENFDPRPKDYPSSIDDPHGPTIQKFTIYIKHNCALLYKSSDTKNIVSDSQLISLTQCFGSKANNIYPEINPPTVHHLNRVTTNLVLNEEAKQQLYTEESLFKNPLNHMGKERQFVDYAPLIFRYIRIKLLNMRDTEYLKSIIPSSMKQQKDVLDAKFGDGKSGAFFYFTHDSRFLVKTIKKHEIELFLETLEDYVRHLKNNPNTILSRCVGLHSLRMYGLTKYFVVMENVFLAQLKPHEVYDLKGSWVGRGTDHGIKSGKVMKDNDLKRFIILNRKNQSQILEQLDRDAKFLEDHEIMDYSLLLGIYHMKICTASNASKASYVTDDEDDERDDEKYDSSKGRNEPRIRLGHFAQSDESHNTYAGGVQAQVIEGPGIYYMGIIDALQKYTWKKKLETKFKKYIQRADGDGISCVDPKKYRERFMNYMRSIIINDISYFHELNIANKSLEKQKMYVYPPKDVVDSNMATIRKQKMSFAGSFLENNIDNGKDREELLFNQSIDIDNLDEIDRIHAGNVRKSKIQNDKGKGLGSVELNNFNNASIEKQDSEMGYTESLILADSNLGSLKAKK